MSDPRASRETLDHGHERREVSLAQIGRHASASLRAFLGRGLLVEKEIECHDVFATGFLGSVFKAEHEFEGIDIGYRQFPFLPPSLP